MKQFFKFCLKVGAAQIVLSILFFLIVVGASLALAFI